ncbi:MAG: T9SS type B sorting domain-containing protein [Winogradskyella sp.]|uniref:T9SS type B sorting domain-containing protein n=1 Tax=Winogradskyella sp. TaxID=1883156 RepID=UPI00385E5ACC
MISHTVFCQLNDFNFTVSAIDETCAGNGSISMTVSGITENATVTYTLYLYPDSNTPIAQTTADTFTNLDSGDYRVEAMQTLGNAQNTQSADITINNSISALDYDIEQAFFGDCNTAGLVINITNGTAELYEIISGPITAPLQTENSFSGLVEGTYVIRVFDSCNNALTKTFTLLIGSTTFTVSNTIPSGVLDNCTEVTITNVIAAGNGGGLVYPISVNYVIFPPDDSTPLTFEQTYQTGADLELEATETIANYEDQSFEIEVIVEDQCGNMVSVINVIDPNPQVNMSMVASFCGFNLNINVTNVLPPYTLEFTEAPEGFDPLAHNNSTDGIYTESNISFGEEDSSLPFGMYSVLVTDACDRAGTATIELIEEEIEPEISVSNGGCNPLFATLNVNIPDRDIVSAIFTDAPENYENTIPDAVSDSITENGILIIENLPEGDYTLELIDECDTIYVLEINVSIEYDVSPTVFTTPNCATETGTLRIASPIGSIQSIVVTEAPETFTQALPFDYSANILSTGVFYVDSLPEGTYTIEFSDTCENEFSIEQTIVAYQSDSSIYNVQRNCGSFDLGIFDNDTSVFDQTYWLQVYSEESDRWVHPNTNVPYTEGEIPNVSNAIALENNETLLNIFVTGNFRLIKVFQPFNNPNPDERCLDIFAEFEVVSDLIIKDVFNLNCEGGSGPSDILVDVLGVAPYQFSIVSPVVIENGSDNIFTNLNPDIYEIRVEDVCGSIETITVNLEDLLPVVSVGTPSDIVVCSDLGNGQAVFDLAQQNDTLLGIQNPEVITVTYHLNQNDADEGSNPIPENFENSINPQTIYARLDHNTLDICYQTASFQLIVGDIPQLGPDEVLTLCDGGFVTLSAGLGYSSYLWSTGESSSSIVVSSAGNYSVTVSENYSDFSCEATKSFSVDVSGIATIESIETEDFSLNGNSITINVSGFGDYQYSLDGINYQPENRFINLPTGDYMVFVRDKNECGVVTQQVYLLNYMKFFTPNGDNVNEYWQILGAEFEPSLKIYVYNRYGKLLTVFRGIDTGWDGRYNGEIMPTSDYWFVVERAHGKTHKGHFTLKR